MSTIDKDNVGGDTGGNTNEVKQKKSTVKELHEIIIKRKPWYQRYWGKLLKGVRGKLRNFMHNFNKHVKSINSFLNNTKKLASYIKYKTVRGLKSAEQSLSKFKGKLGGLMEWGTGSGGTHNEKDRSNPSGSIDLAELFKMFDAFGLVTKSKEDNQLSGDFDGPTATEKTNDVKEIVEYDPDEKDKDFEAIDNLSKNKKSSPVVKKNDKKTVKVAIFKNHYTGNSEVWRTSRESVEKVSKSELKEKYSDAIKIKNDSEADYQVTRD